MEFSEAARTARHDQAWAAQADVVAILGAIARQPERWSRIDQGVHERIEALLEELFAADADDARVCQHARRVAFDRAPRPLVLDAVRGILACWDSCYWREVSSGPPLWRLHGTCFDCGRRMDRDLGSDVFIAYGPILVVGALCDRCRAGAQPGYAVNDPAS